MPLMSPMDTVKPDTLRKRRERAAARIASSANRSSRILSHVIAALPIIALQSVAVTLQLDWARSVHFPGSPVLYAVSVETVALALMLECHTSTVRNLKSGGLFTGSIALGVAVGLLNAENHRHSLPIAVIAFCASALTPVLWHAHSKTIAHERLLKLGVISEREHAVKVGFRRTVLNPVRALGIVYHETWSGTTASPGLQRAIAAQNDRIAAKGMDRMARKNRETLSHDLGG